MIGVLLSDKSFIKYWKPLNSKPQFDKDNSFKLGLSESDNSSISDDEKEENNEVDEKVQQNKISPRFTKNFVKKKTFGVVLGETEDSQMPESPHKHKKKNAPQIQVKIAMSKIPGVSEHLFNHITKRMTAITTPHQRP